MPGMSPGVFACGNAVVGPSNLETFVDPKTLPPDWSPDSLFALLGDPRTVEGRKLLKERSPLNYAQNTKGDMQLDGVARGFGANVIHFKLRPELGWRLDFDEVRSLLRTKPALVSLVNPHNPTGRVMPPADMRTPCSTRVTSVVNRSSPTSCVVAPRRSVSVRHVAASSL